jgi:hypothetical protein
LLLQTTTAGGVATTAMTVDNAQNVGVGVTPSAWNSSWKALQVTPTVALVGRSNQNLYLGNNWYLDSGSTDRYIATGYASFYSQVSGTHNWYTATSGTAGNAITFTQSLAVGKGTSLALEGATSQTGTGISFPATQSASSDVNTLDDYEEGTFTPSLPAGSTGVSYTTRFGVYTKIGNLVTIFIDIEISAVSSVPGGGGASIIEGFPFTSRNTTNMYPPLVTKWNGCNFSGTVGVAQINPNTTTITAVGSSNNGAFLDSTPSNVWDSAGNWLTLSGSYFV